MFDIREPGSVPGSTIPVPGAPVPLERLEAQICELAGHLTAATCRFLVLLADFDARRGWASWEMNSCAQWLSWKCQMSSGAAREHVRVARALRDLPVIREELVHERGYLIAAKPGGSFAFYRPDGTALPPSPPLPKPAGTIADCHDAEITEDTIIPPWYGERLDLDHAIYTCLANARSPQERREQARDPARDRVQVFEPDGWADRIRQYYDQHTAA